MALDDIEDVVGNCKVSVRNAGESMVKSRPTKSKNCLRFEGDSFVPGTKSVYLRTWGCSHNSSDSEYMAGLLMSAGYTLTLENKLADLCILNSCTVKTPSETQLRNELEVAIKVGKPVVVAGCVSQAAPGTPWLKGVSLVGVQQIDRIVQVVEEAFKGNTVRFLSTKRVAGRRLGGASLDLPKIRRNPLIEILAINTGCLNHCTYCKTKQARGTLASYSMDEIVERAEQSFREGVKEIWLTSEDLGAWGRDIGHVLPDLLANLVLVIPDDCMMRLGMTNPPYILDFLPEIASILNHPRVYSFLHIPVQSGSDAVLAYMKREYENADFCRVVDYMRTHVPGISIATDMICAFPTETAIDFEYSMDLVRKYKFPSLFINQFYPRPGTPAARMKRIDTAESMTELFHSYRNYTEDRVGKIYTVLVTERAADDLHLVGHNKQYEQFLLPDNRKIMGKKVDVRVISVGKFSMKARVIESPDNCTKKHLLSSFASITSLFLCFVAIFFSIVCRLYLFS